MKTNMEPEIHLSEKEDHLPNPHFWVPSPFSDRSTAMAALKVATVRNSTEMLVAYWMAKGQCGSVEMKPQVLKITQGISFVGDFNVFDCICSINIFYLSQTIRIIF